MSKLIVRRDNPLLATPITFHRSEFYCGSLHQFESPHPTEDQYSRPVPWLIQIQAGHSEVATVSRSVRPVRSWEDWMHLLQSVGTISPLPPVDVSPHSPLPSPGVGVSKFRVNHNCDVIMLLHNIHAVTSPPPSPCDRYLNSAGGLLCIFRNFIHFYWSSIVQPLVNIFSERMTRPESW